MLDDSQMLRIDLRNDHRHVRRPTVRTVVGHDGYLGTGILLLQCADFVLLHIDGAEHEGAQLAHGLCVVGIM